MNTSEDETIFIEARDAFITSLQPSERERFARCASAQQLILEIQSIKIISRKPSLLRRAISKIEALNNVLSPYFDSIGFFVQSHPEFAAIAWGAIRLALQLASNFNSFFEKLLRTLEQLAEQCPQYDELVSQFKGVQLPPRLKKSLCSIYTDLLRFLQSVIGIFARKDGSARRSHAVFADICWRPFDLRFKDLLENLSFHAEVVKTEIQFANYHKLRDIHQRMLREFDENSKSREKLDSYERMQADAYRAAERMLSRLDKLEATFAKRQRDEDEHQAQIVSKLKRWIEPPKFQVEMETALALRLDGTGEWLFTMSEFMDWRKGSRLNEPNLDLDKQQNILWIHGNPGYGKTVLAASIIEELRESDKQQNTCYFFFRERDSELNSAVHAYRAIMAQTLQKHRKDWQLVNKYAFVMDDSCGQMQATKNELLDIMQNCTQTGFIQNIVLDGVDECSDSIELLGDLSRISIDTHVNIMLFARPNVKAPHNFPKNRLVIGRSNCPDIELFLTRKVHDLVEQGYLPSYVDTATLLAPLITGADGMFLWATLMIKYLTSPGLTVTKRVKEIQNIKVPERLDRMYIRVFELLSQGTLPDQAVGQLIFMWTGFSCRQLTETELKDLLRVRNFDDYDNDVDFTDFEHTVVSTCGSLITKVRLYPNESNNVVMGYRLMHLSVLDFIEDRLSKGSAWFLLSESDSHLTMAQSLLRCISFPAKEIEILRRQEDPLPGGSRSLVSERYLRDRYPSTEYALLYLGDHLQRHRKSTFETSKNRITPGLPGQQPEPCFRDILQPLPQNAARPSSSSTGIEIYAPFLSHLSQLLSNESSRKSYIESFCILNAISMTDFKCLEDWLSWAASEFLIGSNDEDIGNAIEVAREIIPYLRLLQEEWGSKLRERPFLIWDEVTAFTPCRHLGKPHHAKVSSLLSEGLTGDLTSSRYLCKVSEVSADHEHIGVLSVWPSIEYEELAMKSERLDMKKLLSSVSHWIARYEVWTLTDDPKRTLDVRIRLKNDDIWRQYCHSLHNIVVQQRLRVQFPVSISPCIRRFTILQNVYSIEIHETRSSATVSKLALPFSLDESLTHHWPLRGLGPGSPREFQDEIYGTFDAFRRLHHFLTYSLIFSLDGNSVFFIGKSWATQHIHLAVFDLETLTEQSITTFSQFKKSVRTPNTLNTFPEFVQVLHPNCPLAAFAIYGIVYLWAYKVIEHNSSAFPALQPLTLDNPDPKCNLWSCNNSPFEVESVAFSKDGNHLVINFSMDRRPIIIPIPEYVFAVCRIGQFPDQLSSCLTKSPPSESLLGNGLYSEFSGSLIRSAAYTVGPSGNGAGFVSMASNGSVELSLWHQENRSASTAEVEIIALPMDWVTVDHSKTSLQLPKTKDESIRIILNKAARPFYDMTDAVDSHLPAVIERSVGSVRIMRKNGVMTDQKMKLLLSAEGQKELGRDGRDDTSESQKRARKRRRVQE